MTKDPPKNPEPPLVYRKYRKQKAKFICVSPPLCYLILPPNGVKFPLPRVEQPKHKPNKKMSDIVTIPYKNNTLGAASWWNVPANLAELVKKFGEEAVYFAALRQGFYGPTNNPFRKALCAKLEEFTGEKRQQQVKGGVKLVRTKKDGTEIPILETEQDYIKRIRLAGLISDADYFTTHQQVANDVPFTIASPEEEAEPDEAFIRSAKQILAMVEAGTISERTGQPVTEESFTSAWEAANPGHSLENLGGFNELGIARALEIDDKRRKAAPPKDLV